jgi:hypothetical protein
LEECPGWFGGLTASFGATFHKVSCLETVMWTPADRALVGDFGSGQALTDDQFRGSSALSVQGAVIGGLFEFADGNHAA